MTHTDLEEVTLTTRRNCNTHTGLYKELHYLH